MAIIQKSRKRHTEMAPLEIWQQRYLEHDGRHEYAVRDFSPWPEYFEFSKLCGGERPVFLDPMKARHAFELWGLHGADYLQSFISENPGTLPLAWWQWTAPGCADPADRKNDPAKYFRAIALAQARAQWPREKQAGFLRRHGLLTPGEAKRLKT